MAYTAFSSLPGLRYGVVSDLRTHCLMNGLATQAVLVPGTDCAFGELRAATGRLPKTEKLLLVVKLNNNMLETLNGLEAALESAMYSPLQNLQWLDVSFNSLSSVDAELLKFVQLKALYLHGNCIAKFGSIQRLQKLPKLLSLTINGNPIQSNRIYRTYILGVVPQIRALDHTSVTSEEANEAASWYRGHVRRMEVRKEQLRELRDQE
ncbi:unnamed protein product [Cladocopium goreaui]|uniref:Leucine-rich repeat-containing protein 51 n=1 Tax=Cladocopium goreaui TaxID=2562237 RepID=A0A9P1DGH8_9DINO|nr:unnamed protein product [Cladocopium goreaui]